MMQEQKVSAYRIYYTVIVTSPTSQPLCIAVLLTPWQGIVTSNTDHKQMADFDYEYDWRNFEKNVILLIQLWRYDSKYS